MHKLSNDSPLPVWSLVGPVPALGVPPDFLVQLISSSLFLLVQEQSPLSKLQLPLDAGMMCSGISSLPDVGEAVDAGGAVLVGAAVLVVGAAVVVVGAAVLLSTAV